MRTPQLIKKLPLHRKIGWAHFLLFVIGLFLRYVPQPAASIACGDHWFWSYLSFQKLWITIFSLPLAAPIVIDPRVHMGLIAIFGITIGTMVLVMLGLVNSFLLGRLIAYMLRKI